MTKTMMTFIKIALGAVGGVVAASIAVAGYLIYPGTPSRSSSLIFQGYVPLPSESILSVLDYMTVKDEVLFVTGESTGDVYRVQLTKTSLPTAANVANLRGNEPATHGVIIDPVSHLAFVTRSEANTVDVFDPAKMVLIKRIPVAEDPDAIVYDEISKLVYVASGEAHLATLIDPSSQTSIANIPLGGKPEYAALDLSTKLLYQNLHDTSEVAAVDIEKRAVVDRWSLPGCEAPTGMAIDQVNRRLFIGCGNAVLAVFGLDAHKVVAIVPVGKAPDSVVFDATLHRIYVTGKAGVLAIVWQDQPDKYELIDKVQLHYGAHTLAVDSATHALYVGYAGLVVNPRIAVFYPSL